MNYDCIYIRFVIEKKQTKHTQKEKKQKKAKIIEKKKNNYKA